MKLIIGLGLLSGALAALPNNPSGNYTPAIVDCPANRPVARSAATLSSNETAWVTKRRANRLDALITFLTNAGIPNFDAGAYIRNASETNRPNIGLAVSGGGYRALMNGAGFLAAADNRTTQQTTNNSIAGLLQAATYLSGLSGGGWLVGSMFANNFTTIEALRNGQNGSNLWRFDNSIFSGPSKDAQTEDKRTKVRDLDLADATLTTTTQNLAILDTAAYWIAVADQVSTKAASGFDTSLTDFWGRALSYQLINAPYGGLQYTFSSIALSDHFINAETPFPILVADGRAPNTTIVSLNATVYEFNAYETGTWDPTTFGFVPTEYLGSNFSNGVIATGSSSHCVRGFDQFGFVMGTSSSLFNQFLLNNISSVVSAPKWVISAITDVLQDLGKENNDIAQYVPNPFLNYNPTTNAAANDTQLTLVDGGEDLQNIPLHPLIQPLRAVDVIIAVDSSADNTYAWPNGTAVRASYARSRGTIANGTLFPPVPDDNTFVNLGLNKRPTFFGCDASNFTLSSGQTLPPLLVYLPNAPYTAWSNVTTFTPSYTLTQRNEIIQNGFNAATQGNGSVNADWSRCLACAVLSRSFTRTSATVPAACTACFSKYCWDGSLNTTAVTYAPTLILPEAATNATASKNAATAAVPQGAWAHALIAASSTLLLLLFI